MPKKTLRQSMLLRRSQLSASDVRSASRTIQARFIELPAFAGAGLLGLYAPIRNEVATSLVMQTALSMGKTVHYPAVSGAELEFRVVKELTSLQEGVFGILEPDTRCSVKDPTEFDLVVVPGVAFDLQGNRIGYGKGYYDKVLHHMEGSGKLVAFCYDFQLVEEIAGEPHDVLMDMIITEKRVIFTRH